MKQHLGIAAGVAALVALGIAGTASRGESQAGPASLSVGIYTPSVAFATSQDRLLYVQRLSQAIEQGAGVAKVTGRSFTNLGQLKRAKVDFAIVDAQCVAVNPRWNVLALAQIGGRTSQKWSLFSSEGGEISALQGKKLSYVKTGCQDDNFVFNAMLESEIGQGFFGGRVGKPDVAGAVAEVASFKGAQAVFAPEGAQKGLSRVFASASVPTPAFVQINESLAKGLTDQVRDSVVGYGGGGAISGWARGGDSSFQSLRAKMRNRPKQPVFATPPAVRVDAKDILIDPKTLDETDLTGVRHHFEKPPETLE